LAWLGAVLGVVVPVELVEVVLPNLVILSVLIRLSWHVVERSVVGHVVVWSLVWFDPLLLLNLCVAVLVLLRLQSELHQLRIDGVTRFSQLVVFMGEVAFVSERTRLVGFVVSASLRFVFVIDFVHVGLGLHVLLIHHVVHLRVHLVAHHHLLHGIELVHLLRLNHHAHLRHWHVLAHLFFALFFLHLLLGHHLYL
jgi:hypothetical protein